MHFSSQLNQHTHTLMTSTFTPTHDSTLYVCACMCSLSFICVCMLDDITMVICPGIGNHSEKNYIRTFVDHSQRQGYRCAVLNHLGALPNMELTSPRMFTYGKEGDTIFMIVRFSLNHRGEVHFIAFLILYVSSCEVRAFVKSKLIPERQNEGNLKLGEAKQSEAT